MQLAGNSQIRHIISAQFGAAIVVALALLLFDQQYAWSGLIGGLISASINGLTAWKVFVPYRAQNPNEVLARVYGAEIRKLLLTGVVFALVLTLLEPLNFGVLISVYFCVQVMVPAIVFSLEDRQKTR
jgi:ATP synthase protein I